MATFARLRSRKDRAQSEHSAALLEQLELCFGDANIPQPALRAVVGAIRQQVVSDHNRPPFVMITIEQFNFVADWIEANSRRPTLSRRLWRKVFEWLDSDGSGRIGLSRKQIANELGTTPRRITEAMSELAGEPVYAIIKKPGRPDGGDGPGVTYYMNPQVGEFMRRRTAEEIQQYPLPGFGFFSVIDGGK